MKLIVRIFALSLVVAGAAAASVSSSPAKAMPSHQTGISTMPIPVCAPGIPGCGNDPK